MSALACLLALTLAAPLSSVDSLGEATPEVALVQLEGPLSEVIVRLGEHATRVEAELARGEVRSVRVPLSASAAEREDLELRFEHSGGSVQLLEWEPGGTGQRWERLPAGLRSRPIPAPEGMRVRPTPLGFAVVASALLLAVVFRSRPGLAALLGLAASALVFLLPTVEELGNRELVVLEGEGTSGAWLRLRVRAEQLELDPERLLRLGVVPSDAEVEWTVALAPGGESTWTARTEPVAGARLIAAESYDGEVLTASERGAERARARVSFEACWVREAASGARLEARGAWPAGQPLPPPSGSNLPAPPGWLVAGLPAGVAVLLGELVEPDGSRAWIRLTHF